MNKTINIGTEINLLDLLATRLLIQANSGGGKSGVARVIIEETHGIVPSIVMDFDGEYYTLKEKFGDVLVIGGPYADVPISMKSAKMLPKEIISNGLTVVLDLSDLKTDERILYAKYFLEALMELPKQYWVNYFIFIEEAHKLCGQQDKYPSGPAVKDLMTRGRKMGYCGVLITQRISKLHKDAAAECNNKFIGRTFLDLDMHRASEELGFSNKNDRLKLRDLKQQHFFAFGTAIEPHHVHEVVIKNALTKMPKAGVLVEIKPQKPTEKLKLTLAKLNDLPQEAERELKTSDELRKEVNKLRTQLAKVANTKITLPGESKGVDTSQLQAKNEKIKILENQVKQYQGESIYLKKAINVYEERNTNLSSQLIKIAERLTGSHGIKVGNAVPLQTHIVSNKDLIVSPKPAIVPQKREVVSSGDGSLGKCSRAIIKFLAQYADRQFSKAQVGIAIGYSPKSSGFNNSLAELNQKGFIVRNGKLQVNSSAMNQIIDILGDIEPLQYNVSTYSSKLGKCEREIYEVLLANPHEEYSKDQLAAATPSQYSPLSSGFNNSLASLNTLELIQRRNGAISLNPELIEFIN